MYTRAAAKFTCTYMYTRYAFYIQKMNSICVKLTNKLRGKTIAECAL